MSSFLLKIERFRSYYNGQDVSRDYKEAFYWFEKAAEKGHSSSQYMLGVCYYNGHGVVQDYKKAITWYAIAAKQGHSSAQYNLGNCYFVAKDYKKAVHWFSEAAEHGHPEAQYDLGICYYNGHGVDQDYEKAFSWFMKASKKEDSEAQHMLGVCYYSGRGIGQDYKKAILWFKEAANKSHAEAQYMLGVCYEFGKGILKNKEMALKLYKLASDQGLEIAIKNYNRLSKNCFITTAVCNHNKKPDDCYELNLLRWYRDNWLINEKDGPTLIKNYYLTAPKLVEKVESLENKAEIYKYLEENFISRCIYLIEKKSYDDAKEHYKKMVDYLKSVTQAPS